MFLICNQVNEKYDFLYNITHYIRQFSALDFSMSHRYKIKLQSKERHRKLKIPTHGTESYNVGYICDKNTYTFKNVPMTEKDRVLSFSVYCYNTNTRQEICPP
jgi:hypothetical protein